MFCASGVYGEHSRGRQNVIMGGEFGFLTGDGIWRLFVSDGIWGNLVIFREIVGDDGEWGGEIGEHVDSRLQRFCVYG